MENQIVSNPAKQSGADVVIFGVGCSGTTALFRFMAKAYERFDAEPGIFFEPFLRNSISDCNEDTVQRTTQLSPAGIYAHTRAPMFTRAHDDPALNNFVADLDIGTSPSLIKFDRACGRIEYFLNVWPNAKFVFVFRNPCSVIDSVLPAFDFFGGEFHPSDTHRFAKETGMGTAKFFDLSYSQKQLVYWRTMNEAALAACQAHPDRILPISHEALIAEPAPTLRKIMEFCFEQGQASDELVRSFVGDEEIQPLSYNFKNLAISDYRAFNRELDWYFSTLLPACQAGVNVKDQVPRNSFDKGWLKGLIEQKTFDQVDPEVSPTVLRKLLAEKTALIQSNPWAEPDNVACLKVDGSLVQRLTTAAKVSLGLPLRPEKIRLLQPINPEIQLKLPEKLTWKTANPFRRLGLFIKCVTGAMFLPEAYFEAEILPDTEKQLWLKRNGPLLHRLLFSFGFMMKSRVRVRKFDIFS